MSARNLVRSVYLPFALRWLLALSCVTCAVIDRNEATDGKVEGLECLFVLCGSLKTLNKFAVLIVQPVYLSVCSSRGQVRLYSQLLSLKTKH